MNVAYLTRIIRFAAAHRYHRPEWDEAENQRVFGACHNPHGHGHGYTLEVTVEGVIDPVTGFSTDLGALDRILEEQVLGPFDHQHINHAIEAFQYGRLVPTGENLLAYLWPLLGGALPEGSRLHRLRLAEDPTLYVDYYGGAPAPRP